jgi:hypothetical protein
MLGNAKSLPLSVLKRRIAPEANLLIVSGLESIFDDHIRFSLLVFCRAFGCFPRRFAIFLVFEKFHDRGKRPTTASAAVASLRRVRLCHFSCTYRKAGS